MKNLYVLGNWKSNKNEEEATTWIRTYLQHISELPQTVKVIICPAYHHLSLFDLKTFPSSLGVQDISAYDSGAYTGEIAASMVKGAVQYAMIGHSERRKYLLETDEQVGQKAKKAIENGIIPVVCISDMEQAKKLVGIISDYAGKGLILYEPLTAIGSGQAETPESANAAAKEIIDILGAVEVLYGGSVVPENVLGFTSQLYISGVGVGGASLDAEKFIQVISSVAVG